ncbi:MAG: hypothetical protein Q4F60_02495, partial [Candidatus Saccharibacteria bacterium]|nr:hypothetical protein [Candidatus Saccharibacteria bacterium]
MGHDSLYHISSTEAIIESLKSGNFNLDILPTVAYDFGYGSGMFYSQIFHLCSALFFFLTGDLILSVKLVHIIVYFLTGCVFYILLKNLTKNPLVSLLGAFLYLSAPYHLADHLVRDAETEVMVFLFIPLILNSFFHLINNRKYRFLPLFAIGYSGLFLSNSAIAIFFTIFLALSLLLNYRITFQRGFIRPFLKAIILVILLVFPYYLNLIQHRSATEYVVFSEQTTNNNYYYLSTSTTSLDKLLIPESSNDYLYIPLTLNLIVVFGLIFCVLKFLLQRSSINPVKAYFIKLLFPLTLCSLLCILPIFPWKFLPSFLTPLQFAWRLETILLPTLIILAVIFLPEIKPLPIRYVSLAICFISCFYYPTLVQHDYPMEYAPFAELPDYYG